MLLTGFPAGPLQANCYVLAASEGAPCIVIDPGQQATAPLRELTQRMRLQPVAVLLTHGHFDHVASASEVSAEFGAHGYIGTGDGAMLDDPMSAMSAEFRAILPQFLAPGENLDALRPDRLTLLDGGERLELAGLSVDVIAVPGHTPGSTTYRVATADDEPDVIFTGDTLFAGAIGRTDLPGGSTPTILESIREKLLALPDDTVVLPGHGEPTTIGREREHNPFLAR